MLQYCLRTSDSAGASHASAIILENAYYKHDSVAERVRRGFLFAQKFGERADLHPACKGLASSEGTRKAAQTHPASWAGSPALSSAPMNFAQRIQSLAERIFQSGDERSQTRALLCCAYYYALHDEYYRARDLLLMSKIGDFIEKTDVKTQVLYNRAIVMIGESQSNASGVCCVASVTNPCFCVSVGLCAFRQGMYKQAYEGLSGVCGGRVREFLAQGPSRQVR